VPVGATAIKRAVEGSGAEASNGKPTVGGFDGSWRGNPVAEPEWLTAARSYLGTAEKPGAMDNPTIVQFFHDVGHARVNDDETAWCAAFVGSMLERTGHLSTRALNARSYLSCGMALAQPRLGCIVVFRRGNSSWQGHVAFYISHDENYVRVLGGNQSNRVSIATYPRRDLLGYRWPLKAEPALPRKTPSPTQIAIGAGGAAAGAGGAVAVSEGAHPALIGFGVILAVAAAVIVIRRTRKKRHG
jgi:uncharacterized protein (TIGR02594 family)